VGKPKPRTAVTTETIPPETLDVFVGPITVGDNANFTDPNSKRVSFTFFFFSQRMRFFENTVLRRISGPKRCKMIGGWSNLHNGEFHNSCSSPSQDKMGMESSTHEGGEEGH
jgi:hypothetical protein